MADTLNPLREARQWLERAKINGTANINLYFKPLNEAFFSLVRPLRIGTIDIGLEYQGHLYKVVAGSGDCEELLVHQGKLPEKLEITEG